ncbi:MAG TPA: hypothetical protein PLV19_11250 [Nitrosomonas sp.]|nr:hypothetical protein [Nitrosomonas sp.]HQX14728.1 hypothetical protein [Nitrosomonas sp.]HRB33755.1 hypothetical protein [Nitrosomonas sp.]HRB46699.1 hypothetical protein [Nitrosomonas sp.]
MTQRMLTNQEITEIAGTVSSKSSALNAMNDLATNGAPKVTLTTMSAGFSLVSIDVMVQKYAILFSLIILYGCGINSDSDSIIDISHINNMKVGDLVKLSDISQGDWDIVCVLMPYSGGFSDSEDERINRIDQKISELNLSISEGDWHFLFEKEGIVVANSFKTRNKLDIKQKGFDAIVHNLLNINYFTPRYCTEFSQAIIFKFKEHDWNYIILGEIQE